MNRYRRTRAVIGVLSLLLLGGCAGTMKHMQAVAPEAVREAPSPGKSMVVFMRPSTFGFAVQSSVFDATGEGEPDLVGLVAAKKKVAYETEPGKRLFMTIGESADFMHADLEAGKTYYALVTPRMGAWKARFSLKPVKAGELGSDQFNDWSDACEWVEKSDTSDSWAQANMASIVGKQNKYYPAWLQKPGDEQPRLEPGDGR